MSEQMTMEGEGRPSKHTFIVEEISDAEAGYAKGPERGLISALLFDGVMGCLCYALNDGDSSAQHYLEAYLWVFRKDLEYVFSFDNVCEALGIEADALRVGIINSANSKKGRWKRSRRKEARV